MQKNSIKKIYEEHHKNNREKSFSILEKERGFLFKQFIGENKKILDIGCRDGALTKHFSQDNNVLGVDIDEIALGKAKQNLSIDTKIIDLNGNWEELEGEKFNVIVAGEVLEHLYYPDQVIKKVASYLKEGGIFVGSVPNAFSLKNRLRYLLGRTKNTPLEDPTHINQFSYKSLNKLLNKNFKEVEIIGLGRFVFLSKILPNWISFILAFKVKYPKQ